MSLWQALQPPMYPGNYERLSVLGVHDAYWDGELWRRIPGRWGGRVEHRRRGRSGGRGGVICANQNLPWRVRPRAP